MSERDYLRHDFDGPPRSPFWTTVPATKGLILGLAAVHFLLALFRAVAPDAWLDVYRFLALHPEDVLRRFHVWQLVTAALLHAPYDIWHLLFNCLVLWFFGSMIERRIGARRHLLFALTASVAASLGYLLFAVLGSSVAPMVGASGAIVGMTILAAFWYPHTTVLVMFVLPMRLWVLAVGTVALDLLGMLSLGGGVAHAAHLAGALYAFVYHRTNGGVERLLGFVDRFAEGRRRERERRRGREEEDLRERIDGILDKVNREGMGALSEEEKRFLKRASERLRR